MNHNPPWIKNLAKFIYNNRQLISLFVFLSIIGFGAYLYLYKKWPAKDVAQVCTGGLIVLTLFFAALNYEFSNSKLRLDYKAAKELLTFNIASEWHKPTLAEYQKKSIEFENKFITSYSVRTYIDFDKFIKDPLNADYRESLKGILNHFETIGLGILKGLIDKDFMKLFYMSICRVYYVDYYFYINSQRISKQNEKLWINFTNLVEEWMPNIQAEMNKVPLKSTIVT